jgi:hypothetical protein
VLLPCCQAAVEVRKQVNQLDNLTTSKAVDALLNAETVALFNNRQLEVSQQLYLLLQQLLYDGSTRHQRQLGTAVGLAMAGL